MQMTRRGFLKGMAGILAAGVAPAVIGSPILMPVRKLWTPQEPSLPYTFIVTNPGVSNSLLMSIFVEDENGRRVWSKEYTPPMPIPEGKTLIAITGYQQTIKINASWAEEPW